MSLSGFAAALQEKAARPVEGDLSRLAALHTVDALLCLDAGLRTEEGAAIAGLYAQLGGGTTGPEAAAAVIRLSEWDAIHVPSCVTPAAVAVPVALTFASDPDRFAVALEAGYAAGLAFGEAVGGVEALRFGVWPTLFAAPAIAAVTLAIALDLSEDATAHAIAIALAGHSGRAGRPSGSPSARWLAVGEATQKGVRAALAAKAGLRADLSLVSDRWLAAQTETELADLARLSAPARSALASVGLKPFVAARQGSNAIQAFQDLLADGLPVASIERVRVSLPAVAIAVVARPLDLSDRLSTIAHLGLQLGFAAHEPERLFDVARAKPPSADSVALAGRVEIVADDGLGTERGSWPARVEVEAGGRTVSGICRRLFSDAGDESGLEVVVSDKLARSAEDGAGPRLGRLLAGLAAGDAPALREARREMTKALGRSGQRVEGAPEELRRAG